VSARGNSSPPDLVLTCEHAGNRIPREYARLFAGAREALASHRGFDPGALPLAKLVARRLGRPLYSTPWSRLLVEANRSANRPKVWSRYTADLPGEEHERILEQYWRPHRAAVETAVRAAIAAHGTVVHVAVHSFTPELDGVRRNADVAFLYDSRRRPEADLAHHWAIRLRAAMPDLRLRFNYPYRGDTDGLPTALRKQHPASDYRGYELEVNQALLANPGWRRVGEALATTLAEALAERD
jgi:predicted N-formylglutamate amidohydrolase